MINETAEVDDSVLHRKVFAQIHQWYESYRGVSGAPPERFVLFAGLMTLERFRDKRVIEPSDLVTPNNRARTNANFIQKILKRYGEDRVISKEGGRTTASTVSAAEMLYPRLNAIAELRDASDEARIAVIDSMERWLTERATEYLNQKKIQVEINPLRPVSLIVRSILGAAGSKAGAVAQHLVGAKLQTRFADAGIEVENHGYTTADEMLGRPGDFLINDTVFHVTMSPMHPVIQKCASNVTAGYKPYLLVPEQHVATARGLATLEDLQNQISIASIEQFVGQNMDEMGEFSRSALGAMFRRLLETYNARVRAVETDPSLQIEIPENLI